jgi:ferritin-like metal-binding protein YciE
MDSARTVFEHEARSMYDGMKRLERGLAQIEKRTGETELTKLVRALRAAAAEQTKRLEDVFGMLDQRPSSDPSHVVEAFLEEEAVARRSRAAKPVYDLLVATTAGDLAQYAMQTFESMSQTAERAGITTSAPRIGDALDVCAKEHRKLRKDLQKLQGKLLEQVPPS